MEFSQISAIFQASCVSHN